MIRLTIGLYAALLWLSVTVASAQFVPGSRFIGGGFGVTTPIAPEFGSDLNVTLQPEFGRFRSENVASGFNLTLGFENQKASSTRTNNSFTVGIGPFIQRFLPVVPNFGFVLTGRSGLSYTHTSSKTTSSTTTTETTSNNLALGLSGSPGLFYQVNPRWLLQVDLGSYQALSVNYTSGKNGSDVENSAFNYAIGRTFSLGGSAIRIRYFLR
ncbi:hypothetical protein [Spirosoma validum]|uniref:Outer membrane protein beta-barrel domain-containing protein n=1 Tax=Spirosoma validum TaxID=2771355 RepID=A0A927AY03_9BACT|nr:hypothetical protein [Spirosoma validum]MBD2751846.1 hypothetical protein [Spirosoma validum]